MTPLAFAIGVAAGCLACWLYREHKKQSRARQVSAWIRQDQARERMANEISLTHQEALYLTHYPLQARANSDNPDAYRWVRGGQA